MTSRSVTYKKKIYPSVKHLATHLGLVYGTVISRLQRGWTLEQAVSGKAPAPRRSHSSIEVEYGGVNYPSLKHLANAFGIDANTFRARLYRGLSIQEAVEGKEKPRLGHRKEFNAFGKKWPSHTAFAAEFGLSSRIVLKRIQRGWTLEQAVGLIAAPPRFRNFEGHARDSKFKQSRVSKYTGKAEPVPDRGGFKLYLIKNIKSTKVYVGITIGSITARLKQHFSAAKRGRKSALCNAINKYGEDAFTVELIRDDAKSFDELQQQEIREIARRNSIKNGYNTAIGGSLGTVKPIVVNGLQFPSRAQAAEYFGIDQGVFNLRLNRLGWTPEQAAGLKAVNWDGKALPVTVAGVSYHSIHTACKELGVEYKKVISRISDRGWTIDQAFDMSPAPITATRAGIPITIRGKTYPSIKKAAELLGFNPESFRKALQSGKTPDEVFSRLRIVRRKISTKN